MNRELALVAVAIMGILLAGGAYSQLTEGSDETGQPTQTSTQLAIVQGLTYLQNEPVLDSEILVLHLMSQDSPEFMGEFHLDEKINNLDDFHYPLKQFLKNEPIDESKMSVEAAESAYYSNFIDYFSCQSLSPNQLVEISTESEKEFEEYDDAHALLMLQLIKNDYLGGRCGNQPELQPLLEDKIGEKIQSLKENLSDKENFDSWVERIAVLEFAGESISQEEMDYILSRQLPSGGWKAADYYSDDESNPHTTALAIWALAEASHE